MGKNLLFWGVRGKLYAISFLMMILLVFFIGVLSTTFATGIFYNGKNLTDSTVHNLTSNICTADRYGMNIEVKPCVADTWIGADIVQYVNFSWQGGSPQNTSWIFVYDGQLERGSLAIMQNESYSYTENYIENAWVTDYLIEDVNSFTNLGSPNEFICEVGNANNTQMYRANQTIGTNESNITTKDTVYCFTNVTIVNSSSYLISGNYYKDNSRVVNSTRMDWIDVTSQVSFMGDNLLDGNRSFYKVSSVMFQPNQTIQTKWKFTPANYSANGKWHIFGYDASLTLQEAVDEEVYIYLDPWWNSSFLYRRSVNITGIVPLNYTITFDIPYNDSMQSDWDDLRFANTTTKFAGWLERSNSTTATVAVGPIHNNDSFYYHFGNDAVSSDWNISEAFVVGDHFIGNALNEDLWERSSIAVTVADSYANITSASYRSVMAKTFNSTNVTIEMKWKTANQSLAYAEGLELSRLSSNGTGPEAFYYTYISDDDTEYVARALNNAWQNGAGTDYMGVNPYSDYWMKFSRSGSFLNQTVWNASHQLYGEKTWTADQTLGAGFAGTYNSGQNYIVDWIHVSSHVRPAPTVSFGDYEQGPDIITPLVSIVYPTNTTYTSVQTEINYTASDSVALDSCWYSLDEGGTNTSIATCGDNVTGLDSGQGSKNWTVYVNDTSGNLNMSSVVFFVDSRINVTFNYQLPEDINSQTLFTEKLNISYNITDVTGVNASRVFLYYKVNDTTDENKTYINGTLYAGYRQLDITSQSNLSNVWKFIIDDTQTYPASYNIDQDFFENLTHLSNDLSNSNNYAKVQLLNISNTTAYNYFEIMANSTVSANPAEFYYCNSSYSTGNPITSDDCTQFSTLPDTQSYNHTHNLSEHQVIPLGMNISDGTVGTVKVTTTSYFLIRGSNIGTWAYYYIENSSRIGATETTVNSGVAWSPHNYTIDAHIHQYKAIETFYYYICANDTLNNQNCSLEQSDTLELGPLPPSGLSVDAPTNGFYKGNISINYTGATSPNDYDILYYNISLSNLDGSFNKSIMNNNSLNLSYTWDSTSTTDGTYLIKVIVYDNSSQSAYSFSENFTLDNALPVVSITYPLAINYSSAISNLNYTATDTNGDSCLWNNGTTNSTAVNFGANWTGITSNEGNNTWTVYCNDSAGNIGNSSVNFSLDTVIPIPSFVDPTPSTGTYQNSSTLLVNVTVVELNPDNSSTYIYNSTALRWWGNEYDGDGYDWSFAVEDDFYTYNATACDTAENCNWTETRNVTIDTVSPVVNITSPNVSQNFLTPNSSQIVNVTFTVTEINLQNCSYNLTGTSTINTTNISCVNASNNFTLNLTFGSYNLTLIVHDYAVNAIVSNLSFNITDSTPASTTGGGGGSVDSDGDGGSVRYNNSVLCPLVLDFRLEFRNKNYTDLDIIDLTQLVNVQHNPNLETFEVKDYVENYVIRCGDIPEELSQNKSNITLFKYESEAEPCDNEIKSTLTILNVRFNMDYSIPFFNIDLGEASCGRITFLKYIFRIEKVDNAYSISGIKVYWVLGVAVILVGFFLIKALSKSKPKTSQTRKG